jgi:hypothetical protein
VTLLQVIKQRFDDELRESADYRGSALAFQLRILARWYLLHTFR